MSVELCNASIAFQWCMIAILTNMVDQFIEVFRDAFSMFGDSYDSCLNNLVSLLQRYKETNLVLNWEKCHFIVNEGIILGHKVSRNGVEVDKAKIETIEKLPPPNSMKGIQSFLKYVVFYRRFIPNFSKISKTFV